MLRFAPWKVASVILVSVLALLVIVPSFWSESTFKSISKSASWLPMRQIVLGLDLQGGAHLLLEVDAADVTRQQVAALRDDVRRVLREERVSISGGIGLQPRGVQLRVPDAAERARVLPKIRALAQSTGNALSGVTGGPTLQVSESDDGLIVATVTEAGVADKVRRAVDQTIEVLRRRVDALGTTEPNIQRQGADRIVWCRCRACRTPQQVSRKFSARTAKLEFRFVAEPGANPGRCRHDACLADRRRQPIAGRARVMVQGEDLTDAQPASIRANVTSRWSISASTCAAASASARSRRNVGRPFAIVLDNKVISAPRILRPITGGSGQISGRFTVQQANNLAVLLRAGALPAKLTIVEERTVGPGLGQDSIEAGKLAILCRGGALVALYMLVTYGDVRHLRQYRAGRCISCSSSPRSCPGSARR
jgi:SecD/SecF fusion protein